MPQPPLRVLVIDDSALYRKILRSVLDRLPGVEVIGAVGNGRLALARVLDDRPDLITLDVERPELDGLGLLQELTRRRLDIPAIMISAFSQGASATTEALGEGDFDFIVKPPAGDPTACAAQLWAELAPMVEACRVARSKPIGRGGAAVADGDDAQAMEEAPRPHIIGVGVSTGGPAALAELLPRLPADFPCPILVVQHMPARFTNSLAEDLNRRSALQVVEGRDGAAVSPGQIIIAPGGKQMRVATRCGQVVVQVTDDPAERNCKPAVDYLFRSLAAEYGDRALGVLLTGMGDDGTRGCTALKARGATVIAQNEATSVIFGMPRSAIDAGVVDVVLPLDQIADRLRQLAGQEAPV